MIILDRFEGDYAVIEIDEKIVNIEKHLLDRGIKEGDVLTMVDGLYYKDEEATKKRKQYIKNKFKDMWED